MQSINLSNNKTPIDISIFCLSIDENIFKDERFIQLLDLIKIEPYKYVYSFYTESVLLGENVYIPIFHTLYLSSKNHNVIIGTSDDLWLINAFPNNTYYILENKEDKFDYTNYKIKKINNLKSIGEV